MGETDRCELRDRRAPPRKPVSGLEDEAASFASWELGRTPEDDLRAWAIADAVAGLGEAKRLVIVLRYWLDLPLEEIAGVLAVPVGTVASRLNRALADLRTVMEGEHVV
jgi:RNA polymerase sigma factor (sigma-70 family)